MCLQKSAHKIKTLYFKNLQCNTNGSIPISPAILKLKLPLNFN